eukprot:4434410-Pyramimonas_sp.AAC.1
MRTWIKDTLTRRFGDMKLQQIPCTHVSRSNDSIETDTGTSTQRVSATGQRSLSSDHCVAQHCGLVKHVSRSCVPLPVNKYFYRHRR